MRILYLDLDSLRPDHLGCYGYHRKTSPNIDQIAKQGVKFTNYYCSDAPCAPSRTALMSGRFGIHNGMVGHGGTAGDVRLEGERRSTRGILADESFPAVLKQAGYHTASISTFSDRHGAWTFNAGFNEVFNIGERGNESAEQVLPVALKWLKDNGTDDNWFLHLNFWDPHTPYRAPLSYGNLFADEPLPAWLTEDVFAEHMKKNGQHSLTDMNKHATTYYKDYPRHEQQVEQYGDLRAIVDQYDTAIKYMDDHLGKVFETLEQLGIMEDTAIIISADHGENMGELGVYSDHGLADESTCNIPMIFKWQGGEADTTCDALHYHLDLPPTIMDLLGIERPTSWDGASYAPTIMNGEDTGRQYLVFSQCVHVCQRSVRFQDWLYIRTYHDGYHGFEKEMLFHLRDDPYEQHNLAKERPDICREAVYLLNDWHDDMMATMPYDVDPLWTVIKEGGPVIAKSYAK